MDSLTNISFALSRNLEKLADRGQDHDEGLGLSLLGSVAGVVQAPLDALISGNESVTLAAGKGVDYDEFMEGLKKNGQWHVEVY